MISAPAVCFTCDECGHWEEIEFANGHSYEGILSCIRDARRRGWHVGNYPGQPGEMLCLCSNCREKEVGIPWFMLYPCPNCSSARIGLDWDGGTYCPRCKDCGFDSIWVADCEECAIMAWIDMAEIYEREEEEQWH